MGICEWVRALVDAGLPRRPPWPGASPFSSGIPDSEWVHWLRVLLLSQECDIGRASSSLLRAFIFCLSIWPSLWRNNQYYISVDRSIHTRNAMVDFSARRCHRAMSPPRPSTSRSEMIAIGDLMMRRLHVGWWCAHRPSHRANTRTNCLHLSLAECVRSSLSFSKVRTRAERVGRVYVESACWLKCIETGHNGTMTARHWVLITSSLFHIFHYCCRLSLQLAHTPSYICNTIQYINIWTAALPNMWSSTTNHYCCAQW